MNICITHALISTHAQQKNINCTLYNVPRRATLIYTVDHVPINEYSCTALQRKANTVNLCLMPHQHVMLCFVPKAL